MTPNQTTRRRELPTFPASVLDARRLRRRRWLRRLGTVVVIALIAGSASLLWNRRDASGATRYRTSTAQARQIDSVLTSVATIEPVTQANVGFPAAGTVATVDVSVGHTVTAGTVLATLDTAELEQDLRQRQDDLATAQLALSMALDGEDPSGVTGMSGQPTGVGFTGSDTVTVQLAAFTNVVRPQIDQGALQAAQQAVLNAQQAVTTATGNASAALSNAVSVCSAVGTPIIPTVDPNDPTAPIVIPTDTVVACQSALNDVITAQGAVTTAQSNLASASSNLNALLATWAEELASTPTNPPTTTPPATDPPTTDPPATDPPTTDPPETDPPTTSPPVTDPPATTTTPTSTTPSGSESTTTSPPTTSDPNGSTPTTTDPDTPAPTSTDAPAPTSTAPEGPGDLGPDGSPPDDSTPDGSLPDGSPPDSSGGGMGGGMGGGGGGGGGGLGSAATATRTPTAEDLVAYQAAVDAAKVHVEVAEQSIAQATIVSPVDGTVTAVNIGAGDSVEAGSDTETIIIESPDGYEATTTISINDIADVAVGDLARITADGVGTQLDGEVVAIAIVPDSTTTNFRVTIGLNDDTSTLRNGNIATAELVTHSTDAAVAVPNSALTPNGERSTVTVIDDDGQAIDTLVQVGVAGSTWTEITQGLGAGDTIVLADFDAPITNDEISTSNLPSGLPNFNLSTARDL